MAERLEGGARLLRGPRLGPVLRRPIRLAVRENNEARRLHYFGNLDTFRMVANTQFQGDFDVPKDHWRADPYDNQVGEMETEDRGLRYEEFLRTKEVLEYTEL